MTLEQGAYLAEIIGVIVIVVTLIYLSVQVRQGIYTSSVRRWERYGEALQPLYDMLRDAGCYA